MKKKRIQSDYFTIKLCYRFIFVKRKKKQSEMNRTEQKRENAFHCEFSDLLLIDIIFCHNFQLARCD